MNIIEYYKKQFLSNYPDAVVAPVIISLEQLYSLPEGPAKCLVIDGLLNHTLDYEQVIRLAKEKLTASGRLLVFLQSIAPSLDSQPSYWGFTLASGKYIFTKYFEPENVEVSGFGNVLVGRVLLTGGTKEDLSEAELEFVDPFYPVCVGVACLNN